MRATILVLMGVLSVSGCAFDGSALWPKEEDAGVGGAAGVRTERARPPVEGAAAVDAQARRPLVRPLMIIAPGMDRAAYEPSLYNVVSEALDRHPNALFDVVAVTPQTGHPGARTSAPSAASASASAAVERQADDVRQALADVGLPPTRIATASQTAEPGADGEVRVYTRY